MTPKQNPPPPPDPPALRSVKGGDGPGCLVFLVVPAVIFLLSVVGNRSPW